MQPTDGRAAVSVVLAGRGENGKDAVEQKLSAGAARIERVAG